jgi:deazaflavin-dependent oxidoreductase (nitroreductase family)
VDKRRVSTFLSRGVFNRPIVVLANAGVPIPGVAILETTGRRSGRPRRTPVGRALDGDTLWIVAEHGRKAAYVRNIESNPRVRVKIGRHWRAGVARIAPGEDPRARLRALPRAVAVSVRLMGTELLTVRVDLDSAQPD